MYISTLKFLVRVGPTVLSSWFAKCFKFCSYDKPIIYIILYDVGTVYVRVKTGHYFVNILFIKFHGMS